MIPEKIANAWVIGDRTETNALFGYTNGAIIISVQKNGKADSTTIYEACLKAINKHFKVSQHDQSI